MNERNHFDGLKDSEIRHAVQTLAAAVERFRAEGKPERAEVFGVILGRAQAAQERREKAVSLGMRHVA